MEWPLGPDAKPAELDAKGRQWRRRALSGGGRRHRSRREAGIWRDRPEFCVRLSRDQAKAAGLAGRDAGGLQLAGGVGNRQKQGLGGRRQRDARALRQM